MKKGFAFLFFTSTLLYSAAQLTNDSVLVGNHYRSFLFKQPAANSKSASLVFIMHGSGGSAENIATHATKLEGMTAQENILLVYPNGYKHYWNECRKAATSAANIENIDEAGFFNAMITYFHRKYKINKARVFAAGFSGGGHMAYKLALTMPEQFKAVTAVVANMPDSSNLDCTESKIPIPVMIINGTSDPVNPYNGGEVIVTNVKLGTVRSTEQSVRYWAVLNGYKGKPVKELLPDTDPDDGKTIEKYTYKEKGKHEVVLLKVINGKHDYPNDIDVYVEAWHFFKRQLR